MLRANHYVNNICSKNTIRTFVDHDFSTKEECFSPGDGLAEFLVSHKVLVR